MFLLEGGQEVVVEEVALISEKKNEKD